MLASVIIRDNWWYANTYKRSEYWKNITVALDIVNVYNKASVK